MIPVYVPSKAWEYVSIDFFGPLANGEHGISSTRLMYQIPSCCPDGKNTNAKTTIKAIDKIFTNFGRPSRYRSDNGPPFNSYEFASYMKDLNIQCDPSYPYRPQANPVETWMKPLGKCLKIANRNKTDKEKAIRDLLLAYRTPPPPLPILRQVYPQEKCSLDTDTEVRFQTEQLPMTKISRTPITKMKKDKYNRCKEINTSIKRKHHDFQIGQWVHIKNNKRTKFQPVFLSDPWIVESTTKTGVILHNQQLSYRKRRHVDDIKPYVPNQHINAHYYPIRNRAIFTEIQPLQCQEMTNQMSWMIETMHHK